MKLQRTHIVPCSRFAVRRNSQHPKNALRAWKIAMIKKVKGGYQVVSTKGRNLGGPYKSLAAAKKRLREVEFFKHRKP
jgi:hypothetical protein